MRYHDVYKSLCEQRLKSNEKRFPAKLLDQLLLKTIILKKGLAYMKQVVDLQHKTPQRQAMQSLEPPCRTS